MRLRPGSGTLDLPTFGHGECIMGVMRRALRRNGFTLVEVLMVVAIIAILAVVIFPLFSENRSTANNASSKTALQQAMSLAQVFYNQGGSYDPSASPGANTPTTLCQYLQASNKRVTWNGWGCGSGGGAATTDTCANAADTTN